MLHLDARAWQRYEKQLTAPRAQLPAHLPRDPEAHVYEEAYKSYIAAAPLEDQLDLVNLARRESYELADIHYLRAMMRYTANADDKLQNDDFDAAYAGTVSKPYILFGYALLRSFPNEERQHYLAAATALVQGISVLGRRQDVLQIFDRYALSLYQYAQTLFCEGEHKAARVPLRKLIVIRSALFQLQPTGDTAAKYLQALAADLNNQLTVPTLSAADIRRVSTIQVFYESTYSDIRRRFNGDLPASGQLAYIEILRNINANSEALARVEALLARALTDKEFAQAVDLKVKLLQILKQPIDVALCTRAIECLCRLQPRDAEILKLETNLLNVNNNPLAFSLAEAGSKEQPKNRDLFLNYIIIFRFYQPEKALFLLIRDYDKGFLTNNMKALMLLCELAYDNNFLSTFLKYFPLLDEQLCAYAAMMGTLHPYHTLLAEWHQNVVREVSDAKSIDMLKNYAVRYLSMSKDIMATLAAPAEDKGITLQDIKQKRTLALQCCEVAIKTNHLLIEAYEVAVDICVLENNLAVALDFLYQELKAIERNLPDKMELTFALLNRCDAIFKKALSSKDIRLIKQVEDLVSNYGPTLRVMWQKNKDLIKAPSFLPFSLPILIAEKVQEVKRTASTESNIDYVEELLCIYNQLMPLSKFVISMHTTLTTIHSLDIDPIQACDQAQAFVARFKGWEQQFKASGQQQILKTIIVEDTVLDADNNPVDQPILLQEILEDVRKMLREMEKAANPSVSIFPKLMSTSSLAATVASVSSLHSTVTSSAGIKQEFSAVNRAPNLGSEFRK